MTVTYCIYLYNFLSICADILLWDVGELFCSAKTMVHSSPKAISPCRELCFELRDYLVRIVCLWSPPEEQVCGWPIAYLLSTLFVGHWVRF